MLSGYIESERDKDYKTYCPINCQTTYKREVHDHDFDMIHELNCGEN